MLEQEVRRNGRTSDVNQIRSSPRLPCRHNVLSLSQDGSVISNTDPPYATGIRFLDVNGDEVVTALDALNIINELNRLSQIGHHYGNVFDPFIDNKWFDTSGDGFKTALDALLVINFLNGEENDPNALIEQPNFPPMASDLQVEIPERSTLVIAPPFFDPEGEEMSFLVSQGNLDGNVEISDSTITYRPNLGFFDQTETFVIQATDSAGNTTNASVSVHVALDPNLPHPPILSAPAEQETVEDGELLFNPTIGAVSYHGSLSVTSVSTPVHGTLSTNGNWITYTPNPSYIGNDSFSYIVDDEAGNEAEGQLQITVALDQAPVTYSPTIVGFEDMPISFTAAELGTDPNQGQIVSVTFTIEPTNGTITGHNPWSYIPNIDYVGPDSFSYELDDGHNPPVSGTVYITVEQKPFSSEHLSKSEVVFAIIEAYGNGVSADHSGEQRYDDVPELHWAHGYWEELVDKDWHSSGFAVGQSAWESKNATYGELVLLGEVAMDLLYANGIHLSTARNLCWITPEEAASPASPVPTQRGLEILSIMDLPHACELSASEYESHVDQLMADLGQ